MNTFFKRPSQQNLNRASTRMRLHRRVLVGISIFAITAIATLIALPAVYPDTGAAMADAIRGVVGTEPVSALESTVFRVQDVFDRAQYRATGKAQEISWGSSAQAPLPDRNTGKAESLPSETPSQPLAGNTKPESAQSVITTTATAPIASSVQTQTMVAEAAVTDVPPMLDSGWQSFGSSAPSGMPVMARAIVKPDPSRPFVQTAVVRIDLHWATLHLVAGTVEPKFAKGVSTFDRTGVIPNMDVSPSTLLAAFNGGFKAEHGHYGMMVNSKVILPPIDGIATIGFYRDGHIQIGAWSQQITQTPDLIAFRQNCPPLVQLGQVQPNIDSKDLLTWGFTGKSSPSATWRSGLGLSQDRRFLIYVVGKSLTAQTLAVALQQAGAYDGMQLDINGSYTRFVSYTPNSTANKTLPVQAETLLKDMRGGPVQFLEPYKRDFFYVTATNK